MWFQPGGLLKDYPKNPWKELLFGNDEWGKQVSAKFILLAIHSPCQDRQGEKKKKKRELVI